jgi:hypothetical protein
MNEFLAFDDADWELASAYLDNEATPVERAQVESSPSLMGLVAELRSMQTSVAAPAPAMVDRDAMIAAALVAASDGDDVIDGRLPDPVVGRVPGSAAPSSFPPPVAGGADPTSPAPSNVTSLSAARKRRADFWKTPMLVAAALLTVIGVGSILRSGSSSDGKKATTAGAPATSVAASGETAAKAQADQSTNLAGGGAATTAAAAATTAAAAAAPISAETASTAAPAATTAAPSAAATTAAPAATTAPGSATTATTASRTTEPTIVAAAPTTGAGPPPPKLTLQELQALVVASSTGGTTSPALVCPDPTGVPRLAVQILWNGQAAIAYIDQITRSLVVLAVDGCTPLANIPIKDLGRG